MPENQGRAPRAEDRDEESSALGPRPSALLHVVDLGLIPYQTALDLQRGVAQARISGALGEDVLLLMQHPSVVTLGRSSKVAHLVASPELLRSRGVELFEVERGGDVTFHGPGQLVGYPIFDLKRHRQDLHWYLRQVEESLIRSLERFRVAGERSAGYTGVWVSDARGKRKIASIGVHARDWVTWHGFALNVTTDLSYFDLIVPCGISGVTMTSIAKESPALGATVGNVARVVADAFGDVFSLEVAEMSESALSDVLQTQVAVPNR